MSLPISAVERCGSVRIQGRGFSDVGTQNTIEDFSQSQQDKIEFSGGPGVQSFADLIITQLGTDTAITAGADQVTLHNFTSPLTANDFLFA